MGVGYAWSGAAASGGLNHACRLRSTLTLACPTGADVAVPFDIEDYKSTPAMHDNASGAVALAGTVAKTSGSLNIVGTGTSFTSDLLGRWITVPGGANETRIVVSITDATHLSVIGTAFANTASGQTATIDNRCKAFAPATGVYAVSAGCRWPQNATGSRELWIRGNGAAQTNYASYQNTGASRPTFTAVGGTWKMTAGEYVELMISQFSGSTLTADNAPYYSLILTLTYLAAG